MAFGDASGPPANGRQLRELLELLEAAGHSGYRDARGPMGFTQRQASGKFTSSEADEFIEQLQTEIHGDGPPAGSHAPPVTRSPPSASATPRPASPRPPTADIPRKAAPGRPTERATPTALAAVATEDLAAELQSRGWIVLEP